jgi:hexosaminidase
VPGDSDVVAGLLLDTANHFMSVSTILMMIDELALNRFNVLHWHIEDSYSFPLQSARYPALASAGAWRSDSVYSSDDVGRVVDYARLRGVRVVVELDVPGHAYSWGLGYPGVTVPCPDQVRGTDIGTINSVGLDPTKPETFDMVEGLIGELASAFPDVYFHLGGDEVQFDCWNHSKVLHDRLSAHTFSIFTIGCRLIT